MPKAICWNDGWILERVLNYPSYKKLAQDYNETFDENVCVSAIKNHCRYKLNINKPHADYVNYTYEQKKWLIENYPILGCRKSAEEFEKIFGVHKTPLSIKNYAYTLNITVDRNVANSNKLEYGARREGSKRALRKNGDMRIDCGRYVIKTDNGWEQANRHFYKKYNGDIPKNHQVIFADNDVTNFEKDNLCLVSNEVSGLLFKNNMRSFDKNITKTSIKWCELYQLLSNKNCLLTEE